MIDKYESSCEGVLKSIRQNQSTLESIDSVILGLLKKLKVLAVTRDQLRKEVSIHKASIAPIRKSSFEILTLILTYVLLDDAMPESPKFAASKRCNLMLVCKLWQSAVLRCPSLWTFCAFSNVSEESLRSRFQTWAVRSGILPLQAALSFASEKDLRNLWTRYMNPILHRLSGLKMDFTSTEFDSYQVWEPVSFFRKLGEITHLTHLYLYNLDFRPPEDGEWAVELYKLQALEIHSSIFYFPIIAPLVRSICIHDSDLTVHHLSRLMADAFGVEKLVLENVVNGRSSRPVKIPKLDKLEHFENIPYETSCGLFNQLQFSILQSCQSHRLTKLSLTVLGITEPRAIPTDIFSKLTSLTLFINFAQRIRIFIFQSVLDKWLEAATDLKELDVSSYDNPLLLDPILNCILIGPGTSVICKNLQHLSLGSGLIKFPEILHRVFMERTINRSVQDDRSSLSLLIHNVRIRKDSMEPGYYMDWKDANSASFHKFSIEFDLKVGHKALEGFFEIGCKERRLEILQTLYKAETMFGTDFNEISSDGPDLGDAIGEHGSGLEDAIEEDG